MRAARVRIYSPYNRIVAHGGSPEAFVNELATAGRNGFGLTGTSPSPPRVLRELRCDVIRRRETIPLEAQKMIKTAASRADMSVTEWLNAVILDAAADEGVKRLRNVFDDRAEQPKVKARDFASIYSRIDEIAAKIESLAQGHPAFDEPEPHTGGRSEIGASQQRAIFDQLSDLLHLQPPDEWESDDGYRRKSATR